MSSSGSEFNTDDEMQECNYKINSFKSKKFDKRSQQTKKTQKRRIISDDEDSEDREIDQNNSCDKNSKIQTKIYDYDETKATCAENTLDKNALIHPSQESLHSQNYENSQNDSCNEKEEVKDEQSADEVKNYTEVDQNKQKLANLDLDKVIMKQYEDSSNDNNVVCCICQEGDCTDDNEIIFCSTCCMPIHQFCYGSEIIDEIPEGEWNCQRCKFCIENNISATKIKCAYCVDLKGAIKFISSNKWAHISCINWIPEIWFKDERKEIVEISEFDSKKYRKKCDICKKTKGFVLKCDEKKCSIRFHVTCAINNNLIYNWEDMKDFYSKKTSKTIEEGSYIPIYCSRHLKLNDFENDEAEVDLEAAQAYMKKLARNNAKKQKEICKEKNKYFEDILSRNIFDYSSDRLFFYQLRKREQKEIAMKNENLSHKDQSLSELNSNQNLNLKSSKERFFESDYICENLKEFDNIDRNRNETYKEHLYKKQYKKMQKHKKPICDQCKPSKNVSKKEKIFDIVKEKNQIKFLIILSIQRRIKTMKYERIAQLF